MSNVLGDNWCIIQNKSNKWFIMNFMSDNMYNVFGEHKTKYKYVSEPLALEQAKRILKQITNNPVG